MLLIRCEEYGTAIVFSMKTLQKSRVLRDTTSVEFILSIYLSNLHNVLVLYC